jgi:hypothetical protein
MGTNTTKKAPALIAEAIHEIMLREQYAVHAANSVEGHVLVIGLRQNTIEPLRSLTANKRVTSVTAFHLSKGATGQEVHFDYIQYARTGLRLTVRVGVCLQDCTRALYQKTTGLVRPDFIYMDTGARLPIKNSVDIAAHIQNEMRPKYATLYRGMEMDFAAHCLAHGMDPDSLDSLDSFRLHTGLITGVRDAQFLRNAREVLESVRRAAYAQPVEEA